MSVDFESAVRLAALKSGIEAKTGESHATLTDGVNALIAGYGQGGSSGGASGIYMAKITPEEDVISITVEHGLGTTDILLAAAWVETLGDFAPTTDNVTSRVWLKTDIPVRVTSSSNRENLEMVTLYNRSNANINSVSLITSAAYCSKPIDENSFYIRAGNNASACFYGGITYTVIIIAANAEV